MKHHRRNILRFCAAVPFLAASKLANSQNPGAVKVLAAHQGLATDAPIYIAQERGYFREQGLDVQLMRFNSTSDQIAALGTGELSVGVGGVNAALFNAAARDVPIRIVADKFHTDPGYTGIGWVVRTELIDSGKIKTAKDLKGMRISRGQRASASETELVALLREGGLTIKDVITQDLAYSDLAPALANGSIDGAFAISPFTEIVEARGFGRMWRTSGTVIPNHMVAAILYGPSFVEKQPDAARGWMVSYVKGVRDYIKAWKSGAIPDDVVQAVIKYGNTKDPAAVRSSPLAPINPDGFPYVSSMKLDLDYFVEAGYVRNPPALDKVVDRSFADHAVAELGPFHP
jgi:NitT/TauT family transport system substrate-binding protein